MNLSTQFRIAVIGFAILVFSHVALDVGYAVPRFGGDLELRLNEAYCLRQGINPCDVYSGKTKTDAFYGYGHPKTSPKALCVHAYPPWEYGIVLPLSRLNRQSAATVFHLLNLCILCVIVYYFAVKGFRLRGCWEDGVFLASAACFSGFGIGSTLRTQNYGLWFAGAILGLVLSQKARKDILSGFFLFVLLLKPQVGTLFVIPFVLRNRWKPIFFAAGICLLLALPASFLCQENPLTLVLNIATAGMGVVSRTAIIPAPIFSMLNNSVGTGSAMILSVLIGSGICVFLSWRFRHENDWSLVVLPCISCGIAWTYCGIGDKCILLFFQTLFATEFLRTSNKRCLFISFGFMLLLTYSGLAYFHGKVDSWVSAAGFAFQADFPRHCIFGLYQLIDFSVFFLLAWFLYVKSRRLHGDSGVR